MYAIICCSSWEVQSSGKTNLFDEQTIKSITNYLHTISSLPPTLIMVTTTPSIFWSHGQLTYLTINLSGEGEPTHTLVPCWMTLGLHSRNQCTMPTTFPIYCPTLIVVATIPSICWSHGQLTYLSRKSSREGKPSHTIVPCWMIVALPPRNQCNCCFRLATLVLCHWNVYKYYSTMVDLYHSLTDVVREPQVFLSIGPSCWY